MYDADSEVDIISYGLVSLSCKTSAEAQQFFDEISNNDIKCVLYQCNTLIYILLTNLLISK